MANQYKPGQFVWIDGKKHRVTKAPPERVCKKCSYNKGTTCTNPKMWICFCCFPVDCYPKPV